jgi:hypothetical protein
MLIRFLYKSLLLLALFSNQAIASSSHVALIIGNSNYQNLGALKNTTNDAKTIESRLNELGYKTKLVFDLTESQTRREIRNFAAESENSSVALLFYAGHGAQVSGENYLLPVDMEIPKRESDIQLSALNVDDILNSIQSKVKVVFLDACRDNPALIKNLSKGRGAFQGGLAPQKEDSLKEVSSGVFIAYATDSGNIALDGKGQQNSPFTIALSKYITEPISIDDMFSKVSKDVRDATGNTQRPYKYSSLNGIVCLTEECGKSNRIKVTREDNLTTFSKNEINKTKLKLAALNKIHTPLGSSYFSKNNSSIDGLELPSKHILFGWDFDDSEKPNSFYAINPASIKVINSTLISVDILSKPVSIKSKNQTSFVNSFAVNCEKYSAAIYESKQLQNGKVIQDEKYYEPDLIKLSLDFSNVGTIGNNAVHFACNPSLLQPIFTSDELKSTNLKRAFTSSDGPQKADNYYLEPSVTFENQKISFSTMMAYRKEQNLSNLGPGFASLIGVSNIKYKKNVSTIETDCNSKKYKLFSQQLLDENDNIIYYIHGVTEPAIFDAPDMSIDEILKKRFCK